MRKIGKGEECHLSVAVAQLAVKLCELKKANSNAPPEKENLDPKNFLADAWELIEAAREHVSPPVGMSQEEAEQSLNKKLLVPFKKLCDPKRNKGDSETLCGEHWKVYTTKRAFDDLFLAYWHDIGEKWKNSKQAEEQGKLRFDGNSVQMFSKAECAALAKLASDTRAWEEYGKKKLASWKRDGVPIADVLALARFRRERDKRAENLPKKRKTEAPARSGSTVAEGLETLPGTLGRHPGRIGKK
jgi:hypothetical protein